LAIDFVFIYKITIYLKTSNVFAVYSMFYVNGIYQHGNPGY